MKDKILIFIIGLLLGAVITLAVVLATDKKDSNQMPFRDEMQMMQHPDGETPPEKPNGEFNDGTRQEPPSKNIE